uniref:Secreted protein n=1 Tax=Mesocestoides corti TaxID=53468 RepID=A0A5K3F8H3_MESCO
MSANRSADAETYKSLLCDYLLLDLIWQVREHQVNMQVCAVFFLLCLLPIVIHSHRKAHSFSRLIYICQCYRFPYRLGRGEVSGVVAFRLDEFRDCQDGAPRARTGAQIGRCHACLSDDGEEIFGGWGGDARFHLVLQSDRR